MKNYPEAYIEYLVQFHGTRDFFECHEILEEFWKKDGSTQWLALIQLAVAIYHERQQNAKGSLRLYRKVLSHLRNAPDTFIQIGIDVDRLKSLTKNRIKTVLENGPYEPFNLPLTDELLIAHCKKYCEEHAIPWCSIENLNDQSLIFRHKLRDRSDVINERSSSLKQKEREREG